MIYVMLNLIELNLSRDEWNERKKKQPKQEDVREEKIGLIFNANEFEK